MKVFRISIEKYSGKLTASGASNRWNREGEYVLYTAQSRSLATLELVVHRASIRPNLNYKVMIIDLDVKPSQIDRLDISKLPNNWRSVAAYSQLQKIGSNWYSKKSKLVFEIPSPIIPKESNFIINTKHKLFESNAKLLTVEDYFWDTRLF